MRAWRIPRLVVSVVRVTRSCSRCVAHYGALARAWRGRNRHDVPRAPTAGGPRRARLAGGPAPVAGGAGAAAGTGASGRAGAASGAASVRTVLGPGSARRARRHRARCGREPLRRRHRSLPRARCVPARAGELDGLHVRAGHAATLAGGSCTRPGAIGHPSAVAVDSHGDVFIAEATAQRVQEVRAGSRAVVTVAGTGTGGFNGDGLAATSSELDQPTGRGGGRGGRPVHRRHGQLPGARAARRRQHDSSGRR